MEEIKQDTHKTTEARRKSIYKYQDKFERVNCRYPIGTNNRIKKLGYASANKFINLAIAEKLEREEAIFKSGTKK